MKKIHPLLFGAAALALAALLGGCFITSGQVSATYSLPNPFTIDSSSDPFERVDVDLNDISAYADHKDKLKGLADVAIIGHFTNVSGPAGGVEVWITPGTTAYTTVSEVRAGAIKLWGPGTIGATGSTHVVSWSESAKLFDAAGKQMLIDEAKGDGQFTLYTFGSMGTYDIQVDKGFVVLVLTLGV
jgi:hypothetical protein